VRRLLDHEEDVVDELRQEQDVRHVGVECVLEDLGRGSGGDDHDRRPRLLADRRHLGGGEPLGPRRVQDALEVATGEHAACLRDLLAGADYLESGMLTE